MSKMFHITWAGFLGLILLAGFQAAMVFFFLAMCWGAARWGEWMAANLKMKEDDFFSSVQESAWSVYQRSVSRWQEGPGAETTRRWKRWSVVLFVVSLPALFMFMSLCWGIMGETWDVVTARSASKWWQLPGLTLVWLAFPPISLGVLPVLVDWRVHRYSMQLTDAKAAWAVQARWAKYLRRYFLGWLVVVNLAFLGWMIWFFVRILPELVGIAGARQ